MAKKRYVITIEDNTTDEATLENIWQEIRKEWVIIFSDFNSMTDMNVTFTSQELITSEKGN